MVFFKYFKASFCSHLLTKFEKKTYYLCTFSDFIPMCKLYLGYDYALQVSSLNGASSSSKMINDGRKKTSERA